MLKKQYFFFIYTNIRKGKGKPAACGAGFISVQGEA